MMEQDYLRKKLLREIIMSKGKNAPKKGEQGFQKTGITKPVAPTVNLKKAVKIVKKKSATIKVLDEDEYAKLWERFEAKGNIAESEEVEIEEDEAGNNPTPQQTQCDALASLVPNLSEAQVKRLHGYKMPDDWHGPVMQAEDESGRWATVDSMSKALWHTFPGIKELTESDKANGTSNWWSSPLKQSAACAQTTLTALALRDVLPPKAYNQITRFWRENIGKIHPDDADIFIEAEEYKLSPTIHFDSPWEDDSSFIIVDRQDKGVEEITNEFTRQSSPIRAIITSKEYDKTRKNLPADW